MKNTLKQIKKEFNELNGKDIYIFTLLCIMIIFISTFVINNI